ncbi:RHS repeat-associated core domain-containing protein [Pseudomonas sp. IT-P4]|uniref:RHS repeat-associated core domain-containing protein n=1 Tax=Pseudomonas sp. IT-P4 TaxID=3026446 RepID=UPI0039E0DF8A
MSSPQKVLNCSYRYDPLDRLTSHNLSDTPERHRFYCKNRLATEIQGAIGYSIVQQGDLLLAQHQRQNGLLDSTLLATDLQRSVLHTLKSGRQAQPIVYSPYGHRLAESGLTSLLGFNGERPDPVTGHYLLGNGYRAFSPVLMRFNSPDSLSPFGKGGLNSYAYCKADPINNTDPTGHSIISWIARQLGRKSTYYGDGIWSKPGVTARKGRQAYTRVQELKNKIKTSIDQAQLDTFNQDKATVIASISHDKKSPSLLEQLSYKSLRSEADVFQTPKNIAAKFSWSESEIIKRGAEFEQASYAPLFTAMDDFNVIGPNTLTKLQLLERSYANKIQINTYIKRIRTAIPKEVSRLRGEQLRIYNKYLIS